MKQKLIVTICCKVLLVTSFLFLSSCQSSEEVYLYDKSGFLPGRAASPATFQNQNYYQRAPQPFNPYNTVAPNSRAFSNPYDFPQQGQDTYYPYYDTERYYVPPSYYRNVEPTYGSPGGMDMKY